MWGNGSPEVTRKYGAKHRLSTWCPQLTTDPLSLQCAGWHHSPLLQLLLFESLCRNSSHAEVSGCYLDIPIEYTGIYLDIPLISLAGGTLISKTLRYTELISGSVQGGDCTYDNLSWLDLFSCRTCALLTSLRLQPQFSGVLPLRGSVGVVWSGLCFLFNGLFIFLNFNDLTPIQRLPFPLLSLSSRTCFSPGQLPSSR